MQRIFLSLIYGYLFCSVFGSGSVSQASVALGPIVAASTAIPISGLSITTAKTGTEDFNNTGPFNAERFSNPAIELLAANEAKPENGISVEPGNDLWNRLRSGFQMEDLSGPLVEKHEKWYADRPEYLARMVERSRLYLFHIAEEIERRQMPLEIALLPMVESAFNPKAYSPARASGLWQFIPETGKRYGMPQTWWQDKRYDVLAATNGALDYLQFLFEQFGDWQLALAAYNWGEGAVSRAINRNRANSLPTDYVHLTMPAETRNYLPKLQAIKNIVRNPEIWGLTLARIANEPYFLPVTIDRPLDLKKAAELAGLSVDDFIALNPAYKRPVIGGETQLTLLVPAGRAYAFAHQLDNQEESLISWAPYQLRPGETLESLAKLHQIEVAALRKANGLDGVRRVPIGHTLLVPAVPLAANEESTVAAIQNAVFSVLAPSTTAKVATKWHRVKAGESLRSIAAFYQVPQAELKTWNKLAKEQVYTGQRLRILADTKPTTLTKIGKKKSSARPHQSVSTKKKRH